MAAGSRVSAEKRHHNITAIVKDHVFVNFLVSPDTLLRENLDFVNTARCHRFSRRMPSCWRNEYIILSNFGGRMISDLEVKEGGLRAPSSRVAESKKARF